METRWIQDFVTLAEVRNFTRAAELRNVSQAAFSRRIQALEHWLGATLVDRSAYPMRITEAGERFRPAAIALLGQISDVRGEMSGGGARNQVRIAMPYALASTRLSRWWRDWCPGPDVGCTVDTGNVHDAMTAFAAGMVDLVIGYHHALHPLQPDEGRCERLLLGTETVRPYAAKGADAAPLLALPGTADRPVPLLMYSPSVYFARVVDTAIGSASQALQGYRAMEAAMSDVLADLAQAGLGIAWLPDSSLAGGRYPWLVPAGGPQWAVQVDVVAWRARSNTRPCVHQIWERMRAD